MKFIILLACLLAGNSISAQYYYNDLIANQETNSNNLKTKLAKVTRMEVQSLQFDNSPVDNFLCEQYVENNAKHTFTITGSPIAGENHLHAYFTNQSQITKSIDSAPTRLEADNFLVTQNNYTYSGNNLTRLTITSFETNNSREKTIEIHDWSYKNNLPEKLLVIKNNNDTTVVTFKSDTVTKTVLEEIVWYKKVEKDHYYYYYDAANRLTDVVRYHPYRKVLLPQYVFEYKEKEMFKKTNFTSGTKDYLIWFFTYNEKGLKTEEQCYAKGNLFKGRIVYNYTYE